VFDISPYFPKSIRFRERDRTDFENRLYRPVQSLVYWVPLAYGAIQREGGSTSIVYIFVTLTSPADRGEA